MVFSVDGAFPWRDSLKANSRIRTVIAGGGIGMRRQLKAKGPAMVSRRLQLRFVGQKAGLLDQEGL